MKKKTVKIISVILTALLCASVLPAAAFADDVAVVTGGETPGTGTVVAVDAIEIGSADTLVTYASEINAGGFTQADIVLTGNIDLSNYNYVPAGTQENPFRGTFNGNGFEVTLAVDAQDYAGLFGYTDGAEISGVTVSGIVSADGSYAGGIVAAAKDTAISGCKVSATVGAADYAGAVAGYAENCVIENCSTDAMAYVVGYGDFCGGIAGATDGGSISGCENEAYIDGCADVGGIAGMTDGTAIENCENAGTVIASSAPAGGIVGSAADGSVTACRSTAGVSAKGKAAGVCGVVKGSEISLCANTGAVSVSDDVCAGIAAVIGGGKIENCYNAGSVTANSGSRFAGVFGTMTDGTVSRCYNAGSVSGALKTYAGIGSSVSGTVEYCYCMDTAQKKFISGSDPVLTSCEILTAAQMTAEKAFAGFDFESTWEFIQMHGYDYPVLKALAYHDLSFVSTTAPTCTEAGFDEYVCGICGAVVNQNVVEASGHDYETLSYMAPTCTQGGYGDYKCAVCEDVLSEEYDALGHTDADENGKCDVCGEKTGESSEDEKLNIFQKIAQFFRNFFDWIKSLFNK